jgi:hypothetical protein
MLNKCKKFLFSFFSVITILGFFPFSLNAQNSNLKSISPAVHDNSLVVRCRFNNLVSEVMQETLASGMSSSLNFHLQLIQSGKDILWSGSKPVKIQYNVWEKKYTIVHRRQNKEFTDYIKFHNFLQDSLEFEISAPGNFSNSIKLEIVLIFLPERISERQKKKLDYWIENGSGTRKNSPAGESESGFSINLSRLITMFFDKSEKAKIQQIRSAPFTLKSLRNDENASR